MKPLDLPAAWGVSRETLERLRLYHSLLLKWQAKINLVSPNTISDAWERHFVDAAQLGPLVSSDIESVYDLGSGAGFPGMVLAIMRPDLAVTMVESDSKKCAFLQTVSRETSVPVIIKNSRIEAAADEIPAPDLISARALTSLKELLEYSRPWLAARPDIRLIFPKGRQFQTEIDEAMSAGWGFHIDMSESITDKDARILLLSDIESS